jgi:hypothetical protein
MADSVIKYSDLIGEDDTFKEIFANIDMLKKELVDLAKVAQKDLELINPNDEKALKKVTAQVEELTKASKDLETQRQKAVKTRKKLADLTDEELVQREKLKIANRERVQRAKQIAILTNKEAGEIEKLRAKLSLTTLEWKKLTKEELNNTKKGKELVKTKKALTLQLKKLEKQTGDTRRNVGNYTSSLGKLGKTAAAVFLGRSLVDGLRRISGFFTNIIDKNAEFNSSLGGIKDGFSAASESIQFAGTKILEFLAPAIEKVAKGIAELPFIFAGVGAVISGVVDNVKARFEFFGLDLEKLKLKLKAAFTFDAGETREINKRLDEIREEQKAALGRVLIDQAQVSKIFNEAVANAREEFKKFQEEKKKAEGAEARREKRREEALKKENELLKLQEFLRQNLEKRVEAITSIQEKIADAEADVIEDQRERLLRLEELKAKAINEQREKEFDAFIALLEEQEERLIAFYGENSAEVIAFREEAGKELLDIEKKNQELSELQLEQSEARKLKIVEDFEKKRVDAATKTVKQAQDLVKKQQEKDEQTIKDSIKSIDEDIEATQQKAQERAEKRAERQQELLDGIAATTEKVGAAIVATFERQADAAADLVEQQADAVETQRQRAEAGLSNTLKFEQEQLAQREAERIRAEQKAKQAAEFITLLNLVSSYAASGDSNALARGLVDFSLLKALEAGFEEGGYTGDNGTSQIAGVVHGREFVVTADDVKKYGLIGKSGSEFGEAMSDYFYSPLQQNLYNGQANNFKKGMSGNRSNDFARLEDEMRAMRQAFQSVPKNDFDIIQMTDYFVDIAKRVTSNRMTNVSKQRKRL